MVYSIDNNDKSPVHLMARCNCEAQNILYYFTLSINPFQDSHKLQLQGLKKIYASSYQPRSVSAAQQNWSIFPVNPHVHAATSTVNNTGVFMHLYMGVNSASGCNTKPQTLEQVLRQASACNTL